MSKYSALVICLFLVVVVFGFCSEDFEREKASKLFIEQCSKCHRKDGRGIKGVYPPLKNSDYVQKGNKIELLRGMIYGRSGKIVVNGEVYYGVMTTEIEKNLTDSDVALILEYVFKELNSMNIEVTEKDVIKARKEGKLPVHQ